MQLTRCLQRCRIWWSDCWTISRSSIARSANSKRRSRRGIAAVSSARSLRTYRIGLLGASALGASIADARSFDNGRQMSAWIGLVPRQHSSGGKPTLTGDE